MLIGHEDGFFSAQGLRVEIVPLPNLPAVRQALLNGTVDVAVLSVGATMLEQSGKLQNLVLLQGRPNATIVTRKELKIRAGDIRGLRGKRIGVDALGGRTDMLLDSSSCTNRIDPDRETSRSSDGDVPGQLRSNEGPSSRCAGHVGPERAIHPA